MEFVWRSQSLSLSAAELGSIPEHIQASIATGTNSECLDALARLALDSRWTLFIFKRFEPLQIDFCNRWLDSHDTSGKADLKAFCALSRVLDINPHLAPYAIELACRRKLGLLRHAGSRQHVQIYLQEDERALGPYLLALYRCLTFDRQAFSTLIYGPQVQALFNHSETHIRFLAISILGIFLQAADAAVHNILNAKGASGPAIGTWDDREIDFRYLKLWEIRRRSLYAEHATSTNAEETHLRKRQLSNGDLCLNTISLADVLQPVLGKCRSDDVEYVSSPTTDENLTRLATALLAPKPVLLTGNIGSGKSFLVLLAAKTYHRHESILTLHLNEQTDAKLLVGMYTSAGGPGSFKWQPGVLTTAVREGRWALIEDLDRAPAEVISTLLPLIEKRKLYVPNLGGFVDAHPSFKLFATIRTSIRRGSEEHLPGLNMLGIRHWERVHLKSLPSSDLQLIMEKKFSVMNAYAHRIVEVYQSLINEAPQALATHGHGNILQNSRMLDPHDLFKAAGRISHLLGQYGVKSGFEPISSTLHEFIFLELLDCFASFVPSTIVHERIAEIVARALQIAPQRRDFCLKSRIPKWLVSEGKLNVGRVELKIKLSKLSRWRRKAGRAPFAFTNDILRRMETIASAVQAREPCLLVGETGTGKTTVVQQLAESMNQRLTVVNLSQQSEAGDLLGGFKPLSLRSFALPLKDEFEEIFTESVSSSNNIPFLKSVTKAFLKCNWPRLLGLWTEAVKTVGSAFGLGSESRERKPAKRRKLDTEKYERLRPRWERFAQNLSVFEMHVKSGSKGFAFHFMEGNIVKAVREGSWILLDEINLASPDTLESLADLLTSDPLDTPSLILAETGEVERVRAHPDFRIFAAMNPATDIGKRDLPQSLRSHFTEIYVPSPDQDRNSLIQIVESYLGDLVKADSTIAANISDLYMEIARLEAENKLVDGANQKPHYSLRTLTRTMVYALQIVQLYGLRRSIYEGFCMSFLTLLDRRSSEVVVALIEDYIVSRLQGRKYILKQAPKRPEDGKSYVAFAHYWMRQGPRKPVEDLTYIQTPFVKANLLNLVRAASSRKFPVLLQGPTSSGKTSMVEYLAKISGNKFVRINNHEHTDLQEYLGTYTTDNEGQLLFQEGILVQALRQGHWIVLDELNLAPTDILEALNRLLDDNRELFIPETQEVVTPHENFMLFATQNPAGLYGGRKTLSRAFRNRFLELHFDDIPEDELQEILEKRTRIAPSYCRDIIQVYRRLSVIRQSSRLFEQKNSFATLRDLFRWAQRDADDRKELANHGFMLLAERVRAEEEKITVQITIEEIMKTKIDANDIYSLAKIPQLDNISTARGIVWTYSMRRIFILTMEALKRNEPVLLIGGTGCGKTTICQIIAELAGKSLHIVNAHQNTETGDIIGAQRPIRNRALIETQLKSDLEIFANLCKLSLTDDSDLEKMIDLYQSSPKELRMSLPPDLELSIEQGIGKKRALFEWADGSLVQAMRSGEYFLLDEISLADDSVLERINSVLESGRSITLAEKGSQDSHLIASESFQFFATMNPGGDFGKRELSPALRNRFTEIWVPPMSSENEIAEIVKFNLEGNAKEFAASMVDFAHWFGTNYSMNSTALSIREILAWTDFVNCDSQLSVQTRLLEGAALVYIDRLGANPTAGAQLTSKAISEAKNACLSHLSKAFRLDSIGLYSKTPEVLLSTDSIQVGNYTLPRKVQGNLSHDFSLQATTTKKNVARIIRALQLQKPILLEGSPGVGKTTLVTALAEAVGIPLTRINLSEQTDIMDLFGSDVPVEGGEAGAFTWRDAPFLQAMQKGEWVLLDEMNLASQSVLEGLNACLDHRGEVYVPELDQKFRKNPEFVLFAAQNPFSQGGGRKGLPLSFVNRFTVVYADTFTEEDLLSICTDRFPDLDNKVIEEVVRYTSTLSLYSQTSPQVSTAGGPWEFNLRDVFRWLQLITADSSTTSQVPYQYYEQMIFLQRFRSRDATYLVRNNVQLDRLIQMDLKPVHRNLTPKFYQVGVGFAPRSLLFKHIESSKTPKNLKALEAVLISTQFSWPVLLVGPSGCGKTNLIRHAAFFVGADLVELPMSTDMDTMDLVGGYEQIDHQRLTNDLLVSLRQEARQELLSSGLNDELRPLWNMLESSNPITEQLQLVEGFLVQACASFRRAIWRRLLEACRNLQAQALQDQRARFEWTDGILVRALEEGKWLVLDHANLCSPSVLDRLNSLLEPDGTLIINEHRNRDGTARVVRPHPDFRLFLLIDPRHGELSRAMRNRCVELFMPSLDANEDTDPIDICDSSLYRLKTLVSPIWSTIDQHLFDHLLSTTFDSFSLSDKSLLDTLNMQFKNHFLPGSVCAESNSQYLLDLHPITTAEHAHFCQRHLELCERFFAPIVGNSSVLISSEPLYPLSNPILLPFGKFTNLDKVLLVLSDYYDVYCQTSHLQAQIQHRQRQLYSAQRQPKTRLDQSMMAAKNLSFSKTPTAAVIPFIAGFSKDIIAWLKQENGEQVTQACVELAREMASFSSDLVGLADRDDFDDASFQTMLRIGRDLSSKPVSETSNLRLLQRSLSSQLDVFHSQWRLSSGLGMTIIWNLLQPHIVQGQRRRELLEETRSLALQIDSKMWRRREELHARLDVRSTIKECYDMILNVEDLPEDTQGILQFQELLPDNPLSSDLDILSLLSCRKIQSSLMTRGIDNATAIIQSARGSLGIGLDKFPLSVLKQHFVPNALVAVNEVFRAPIDSLPLLLEEIELLPRRLVRIVESADLSPLRLLNEKLLRFQEHFLHSQKESIDQKTWIYCYAKIQQIQTLFVGMNTKRPMTSLTTADIKSDREEIQKIWETHLTPSIEFLEKFYTSPENEISFASNAWLSFFTGMLLLYIPDRAFDPALEPIVRAGTRERRMKELQRRIQGLEIIEKIERIDESTKRTERLRLQLGEFSDINKASLVYRPQTSRLGTVQAEFSNILTSIVTRLKTPESSNLSPRMLELLSKNTERAISNLEEIHDYEDLSVPAVQLLHGLSIGLSLSKLRKNLLSSSVGTTFEKLTPLFGFDRHALLSLSLEDLKNDVEGDLDFRLLHLQTVATDSRISGIIEYKARESVQDIFNDFYLTWKKKLVQDRRNYATKTSLYRYGGPAGDDDQDIIEKEVKNMFPDFESSNQDLTPGTQSNEIDEHGDVETITRKLADVHYSLFNRWDVDNQKHEIFHLFEKTIDLVIPSFRNLDKEVDAGMPAKKLLPLMLQHMNSKFSLLASKSGSSVDFYKDSNVVEIRKLIKLTHRVQIRFGEIHAAWTEQASPRDVLKTTDELLQFEISEPLAKFLTKVEQLHTFVYQWQQVASREFSAVELYNELTDLIINWRRLELSTWASLLNNEDQVCAADSKDWWFIAYETIVVASMSHAANEEIPNEHVEQLIQTLSEFLRNTCLGQFSHRLDMIESFSVHVASIREDTCNSYLENALVNFLTYYRRYEAPISEYVKQKRMALEKKLKEIIVLSSWKDTNIEALRSSAKSSHAKLFRVVRKYRSLLAEPASQILAKKAPFIHDKIENSSETKSLSPVVIGVDQMIRYSIVFSRWDERPERFRNPAQTLKVMEGAVLLPKGLKDAGSFLKSWIEEVVKQSKLLKDETPSAMTDENKGHLQNLKSRKRRLFADVLKFIRLMGIKTNIDTETLSKQASLSKILCHSQSPKINRGIILAYEALYSFFDNIHRAQDTLSGRSMDLANSEVQRCFIYAQNLGSVLLNQRECLLYGQQSYRELKLLLTDLEIFSNTKDLVYRDQAVPMGDIKLHAKWMPEILSFVQQMLEIQSSFNGADLSEVVSEIIVRISNFQQHVKTIEGLKSTNDHLSVQTVSQRDAVELFNSAVSKLAAEVEEWQRSLPEYYHSFEHLRPWLQVHTMKDLQARHSISISVLEDYVSEATDCILLEIQKISRLLSDFKCDLGDNQWLVKSNDFLQRMVRSFSIERPSTAIKRQISYFQGITKLMNDDLSSAATICSYSLAFFQEYCRIFGAVVQTLEGLHISTLQSSNILSEMLQGLLSQGFCDPEEAGNATQGSDKLEDGDGLGDGEGANDISKDIDDEDDLNDLAQGGTEEQKGLEEEENAVDMADRELEGNLDGDAEEREDSENAKDNENDTEPEEQIDDVDKSDPEVLDEKMWDGKGEDENEKQGEADKTDGQKKEDVAAEKGAERTGDQQSDGEGEDGASDLQEEDPAGEALEDENVPQMDSNMKEEEKLDLPDDMQLDGDQISGKDTDSDDSMDDVYDMASEAQQSDAENERDNLEKQEDMEGTEEDEEEKEMENDLNGVQAEDTDAKEEGEEASRDQEDVALNENNADGSADANEDGGDSNTNGLAGLGDQDEDDRKFEETLTGGTGGSSGARNDGQGPEDTGEDQQAEDLTTAGSGSGGKEESQSPLDSQTFKRLGNTLEKFHKSLKEIQKASEQDKTPRKTEDQNNDDFEHLPDADTEAETQALGAADDDEIVEGVKSAIDLDMLEPGQDVEQEAPETSPVPESSGDENESLSEPIDETRLLPLGSSVFTGKRLNTDLEESGESTHDTDDAASEDQMQELDDGVSEIHLTGSREESTQISFQEAQELWSQCESTTHDLALALTEQLRLILAPTLATKMRGDFRTGKRLNIKRIIPYIASQYKRDKIWMRRSVPSKRSYQIMLAVDDSKSMDEPGSGSTKLAFETLALVSRSLSMLEAGQLCVVGFGEDVKIAHAFDQPFSSTVGPHIVQQFQFQQKSTNVRKLIHESLHLFREARARQQGPSSSSELWQLQLIISDGICEEHDSIVRMLRQAHQEHVMVVFIIVDALKGQSITSLQQATFETNPKTGEAELKMSKYLDDFPFNYYLIVGDVRDLPAALAMALRQWFAEVSET